MKKKRFKFRFFRLSAGLFCYRTIWLRLFDSDCLPDYFSNNLPDCLPNGLLSNCFSNYFVRLFVGLFFELLSRLSAWLKTVSNFIQWNRFFGFQLKLWNVEPERLRMNLNAKFALRTWIKFSVKFVNWKEFTARIAPNAIARNRKHYAVNRIFDSYEPKSLGGQSNRMHYANRMKSLGGWVTRLECTECTCTDPHQYKLSARP